MPVLAMAIALVALQFAALSGFDPAAARSARAAGTVTPDGGETAAARQVLRATLAADVRVLGERADGKTLAGGPQPLLLPFLPTERWPAPATLALGPGSDSAVGGVFASHYRVRAPPA
ncbi:hypothetical protein SAMN05880582_102242 [Rhizobium sp. RU20A]|nr:hypothetical protein SAMN05880582_102242 [Rhizobium sp. RU20A]